MFSFHISARTSHITQIAAKSGDNIFTTYVLPKKPIEPKAAEVTGLTTRNGKLFHHRVEVPAVSIKEALQGLFEFLSSMEKKIIYGHNIRAYDCHILLNALNVCQMSDMLSTHCDGFVDTLKLFKSFKPGLQSYTQRSLYESLLNKSYTAHDAVEDVKALEELVSVSNITSVYKEKASFSVEYALESYLQSSNVRKNSATFNTMLQEKVISSATVKKLAGSGLRFTHLQLAFERNGNDGISNLLTELNASGYPRVTKSKKIITAITDFLSRRLSES